MFDLLQMEWFPAGLGATLNADGGIGLTQSSRMVHMLVTGAFFRVRNISHSVTLSWFPLRKGRVILFFPPNIFLLVS